jgi:hypothetical protein
VIGRTDGVLGKNRVETVELLGRDERGREIRMLTLADSSRYRTYGVSVFSGRRPSLARLAQARLILGSIRFTKPG